MANDISESEVRTFLKEWVAHYEAGSDDFFNDFAKDFSGFTISVPTRIDGAEEFARGFDLKRSANRKSQILSPEIRTIGSVAVVSFHNRVLADSSIVNMRATVVLQKGDDNKIRIIHLHNSPLSQPAAPSAGAAVARSLDEVTLLEERVASAAAAVGTPK